MTCQAIPVPTWAICLVWAVPVLAAEPEVVPLWSEAAPMAKGTEPKDTPTVSVWLPDESKSTGAAVVVFPGGGYGGHAMDHEGKQIAQWLVDRGIAAFVCKYRLGRDYPHPVPLTDAQRAVRLVRANGGEHGISPDKIGVWGFSAGGHLASTISTHFDEGDPDAKDPVDRVSCRPDFAILCYPVISMKESLTHAGSRRNLLGEQPAPELVESLSNELQVTPQTPPTFLFHTNADGAVHAEPILLYFAALRKAGVPAELHIYEKGPHGVGLAPHDPILSSWPERLQDWLKLHGILPKK